MILNQRVNNREVEEAVREAHAAGEEETNADQVAVVGVAEAKTAPETRITSAISHKRKMPFEPKFTRIFQCISLGVLGFCWFFVGFFVGFF